jgi:hypothetical protein
MLDARRPDAVTHDEPKTPQPPTAERVVARSFYKTLRENGYTPKELFAVSSELIDLVTRDLWQHD